MDYEFAPSNPQVYNNLFYGPIQGSGGSTAMANSFMQYRTADAAVREMLIRVAAEAWGVNASDLDIVDSHVTGAGQSASIRDFVAAASAMDALEAPVLKTPDQWRLIDNPDVRRIDGRAKGDGTAIFGMDVHLPNQMVVVLTRPEQMGGLVSSFDDTDPKEMKSFIRDATLPNNAAVAVYAEDTWSAIQACDMFTVEWGLSNAETRSSDQVKAEILVTLDGEAEFNVLKMTPPQWNRPRRWWSTSSTSRSWPMRQRSR